MTGYVNSSDATEIAAVMSSAGRDEDEVRHLDAVLDDRGVDERGEADRETEQVEDRLPERADDDRPAVRAHGAHHVLGDVPGAERRGLRPHSIASARSSSSEGCARVGHGPASGIALIRSATFR